MDEIDVATGSENSRQQERAHPIHQRPIDREEQEDQQGLDDHTTAVVLVVQGTDQAGKKIRRKNVGNKHTKAEQPDLKSDDAPNKSPGMHGIHMEVGGRRVLFHHRNTVDEDALRRRGRCSSGRGGLFGDDDLMFVGMRRKNVQEMSGFIRQVKQGGRGGMFLCECGTTS